MIKYLVTVIALLLVVFATPAQAQVTVTNTFVAGDVVYAAQVNTNFNDLASNALNRAGGTITGNIVVSSAITIDGIDIGAVLGGTGTPTFTSVTYTTFLKSTTALATPSALSATQATAFASTVSGASLMGFGTTNDVSLMNRAGTVVLGVGPNTTAVNIPGTLTVTGAVTSSGAVTGNTLVAGAFSVASTGKVTIGITNSLDSITVQTASLVDGYAVMQFRNAVGQGVVGMSRNAGGDIFTGSGANMLSIGSLSNTGIEFGTNGIKYMSLSSTGLLTVSGFGTNSFSAGGTGGQELSIRNTTAGTTNYSALYLGNDAGLYNFQAYSFSSTYTTAGRNVANGVTLEAQNAGGLSIAATNAAGAIRFYSGGSTERWKIAADGTLSSGTVATNNNFAAIYGSSGTAEIGSSSTGSSARITFYNSAPVGSITTSGSATAYNISSDARLKRSLGIASHTDVLSKTVIRDFEWLADGVKSRGVFAQEAYLVFPAAITVGDDSLTSTDKLAKPWMADYSKYVPDLIVGWQQHDATISQLAARIAALESQDN